MSSRSWLWAAVLLVLCVGLASGQARAVDSWEAVAQDLPSAMVWDEQSAVSVDAKNTGTDPWDTDFSLRSVEGVTDAAIPIDRWGITSVPVTETVAPDEVFRFAFGITAPPIATLRYVLPLTPTSVAGVAPISLNWMMARDSSLIRNDTAVDAVAIDRFPDILPGTDGDWAAAFIEELAGRVPLVVQGYPNGTYGPRVEVTRAQMAVFMQRALELPLEPPEDPSMFSDVPAGYWAVQQIEALARADVVQGFPGGNYQPELVIARDAMAVFVARGVAGGDENVPSGPSEATFPDVPTDYWAYKYIEFAVSENIVEGFPGGNYQPLLTVTRDQMAVFIYRGFVQPTGAIVVLAGPAVTRVDPAPQPWNGWSTIVQAPSSDPGNAYVGFDAVRMLPEMAPITVTFDLREQGAPSAAASADVVITEAEIVAAQASLGTTSGAPYIYAVWDIPTGLPVGDLVLTVTVDGVPIQTLEPRELTIF
jgi:hypothetical protein